MYVDANGQVHEGSEGERFDPLGQGYRLTDGGGVQERFERAADNAAALARGELNVTVPTAVKVVAGVVTVGVVALPVGAMLLYILAARKAARAAAAAAPYIAEAGPVIVAAVPEAAPVVAAAGVFDAVRKVRAGQPIPAGAGNHLTELAGAFRAIPRTAPNAAPTTPSATVPGVPTSGQSVSVPESAPSIAVTERDPSRSYAGQLLGALRTIAPQPAPLRVEVDGVPVRAELMEQKR